MQKIKLLYISQATGGVQRHIISLLEKIDRDKFEITVICPPKDLIKGVCLDKESFVEELKRIGIRAYPISMCREIKPVSDLLAFFKIYFFIKKEKFDIVHTHSSKAGFLGRIAARMAQASVIIHTPHSPPFDRPPSMLFQKILYIFLEKFAGLFCDKIITVCNGERDLVVKLHVVPLHKVEVIKNAIDLSLYDIKFNTAAKKIELDIEQKDKVVVLVGRMASQKAPFDFIKAAVCVKKDFAEVKFLLLGDGPLLKELSDYVIEKGYSDFIKILGWRNDTMEIISISDIFVLSSLWESLPYSLLDAMAFRKPIVTTDTLGPREYVEEGYNGFVVPRGKPIFLGEAILRMLKLKDSNLREYGARSRQALEKTPNLDYAVKRIENLYKELLCEKTAKK